MTTPLPSLPAPLRACVFALGGWQLATDIRHTREVVVLPDRTAVPRAPAHVVGVANLRGHVVPIVDITHALGLPARPASETARTIVLEDAGVQLAVPADEVLGLESFDDVLPPDAGSAVPLEGFALGFLRRPGGVATLLDVPKLIAAVHVGPPSRPDA